MNNLTYLLFNLAVVAGPMAYIFLTSTGRQKYIGQIPIYLKAIAPVALVFIIWDVFAVAFGHWDFNPEHTFGLRIAGLAVEEIMFFFTVPFALLFLFDNFGAWLKDKQLRSWIKYLWLITGFIASLSSIFVSQGYTSVVLLALALIILWGLFTKVRLYQSQRFWQFIAAQFGLFFIFNLFLTAVPVIIYGQNAILGIRIITIPIEDFIYSFTLTTACLLTYSYIKPDAPVFKS